MCKTFTWKDEQNILYNAKVDRKLILSKWKPPIQLLSKQKKKKGGGFWQEIKAAWCDQPILNVDLNLCLEK